MMTVKDRKLIAKVLGDKVCQLRDGETKLTDDERYIALVNLYDNTKISEAAWETVLDNNDYFHIQNSKDFCDRIQSAIDKGADKKYAKYISYVQKLGTEYFAPAYLGGFHGALHMMCQSIVIYLFNDRKTFLQTKRQYQEQMKTMFHCYQKKATKQGAWGTTDDQFGIQPEQLEADIEHPKNFDDVLDVLGFYRTHRVHYSNIVNDWLDVHYCLSALAHKYDDKHIKFSRDGVLDTYTNGYAVKPDDARQTVLKRAKKSDLYSTETFQKDCTKTYSEILKLYQKYQDGATPKVANARKTPDKTVKPVKKSKAVRADKPVDNKPADKTDNEHTVKASDKQPVQESLF